MGETEKVQGRGERGKNGERREEKGRELGGMGGQQNPGSETESGSQRDSGRKTEKQHKEHVLGGTAHLGGL